MPGTPDPVLGSDLLTLVAACAVAAGTTAVPVVAGKRDASARRLAVLVGAFGAAFSLAVWWLARFATDAFESSLTDDPLVTVGFLAVAGVALAVQAGLPTYLYVRWGLRTPLAGLFVVTAITTFLFLRVRGETDPIGLYPLFFAPLLIAVVCVVALGEWGLRRLLVRRAPP